MTIDSLILIGDGGPRLSVTGFETIAAAQAERAATAQGLILELCLTDNCSLR